MPLTDAQLVAALAGVLHLTQFTASKKYYTLNTALSAAAELVASAPKALDGARQAHGFEQLDAAGHRKKAVQLFQLFYAHARGKDDPSQVPRDILLGMEVIVDQIIAAARQKE